MDGGHLPLRSLGSLQWKRGRLEGPPGHTLWERHGGVSVFLLLHDLPQGLPWQHGSEKAPR